LIVHQLPAICTAGVELSPCTKADPEEPAVEGKE